jgi:ABC-type nitrate/sulfonate/bicarbonate transport system substrate-binding protein
MGSPDWFFRFVAGEKGDCGKKHGANVEPVRFPANGDSLQALAEGQRKRTAGC